MQLYILQQKGGFSLVKTIRETQEKTTKDGDVFSAALASELDGRGLLRRVNQWASWILPKNSNINLEELLLGDTMVDPIGNRLRSPPKDDMGPLTKEEVDRMKDDVLEFLRYRTTPRPPLSPFCMQHSTVLGMPQAPPSSRSSLMLWSSMLCSNENL